MNNMGNKKGLTVAKSRNYMYKGAKYMGDYRAIYKACGFINKGQTDKARKVIQQRVATRIAGKFTGRALGVVRNEAGKCFVATVVYGDKNAYEVNILREYRDNILMNNYLGRKFVDFYYSGAGEKTANFIKNNLPSTIPLIKLGLDYIVDNYIECKEVNENERRFRR